MNDLNRYIIPILEVSQKTAIIASKWCGLGDSMSADKAAVDEMRRMLNNINFSAQIVIGEGERDCAPMLYIGEKVGIKKSDEAKYDIAVDPLEGTNLCAKNLNGALVVIALSNQGDLLAAPDVYMEKIAVGPGLPEYIIDLDVPVQTNISKIAQAKGCNTCDLTITILKRPRHQKLIEDVLSTGAKINLITDGDITAIIQTAYGNLKTDMYVGIGGAPEGVLAAAALKTLGGQMITRLQFNSKQERERAKKMGVSISQDKKYTINEMVRGNVIFCATGVTDSYLLKGVKKITTQSLILSSQNNLVQII